MKALLQQSTTKELLLDFKYIIRNYLPTHLHEASSGLANFSPEHYNAQIKLDEDKLAAMNATPLSKLIEEEMADYHQWISIIENNLTSEDKALIERANKFLAELNQWQPEADCSKHLKEKVITYIEDVVGYNVYQWAKYDGVFTKEVALRKLINRKSDLETSIKLNKKNLQLAIKIEQALAELETQLKQDMESLK